MAVWKHVSSDFHLHMSLLLN